MASLDMWCGSCPSCCQTSVVACHCDQKTLQIENASLKSYVTLRIRDPFFHFVPYRPPARSLSQRLARSRLVMSEKALLKPGARENGDLIYNWAPSEQLLVQGLSKALDMALDTARKVELLHEFARDVSTTDSNGRELPMRLLALARTVQPIYDQMQHLAYSAVVPAVIRSANDLDLLRTLARGARSTAELVAQTGADEDLLSMSLASQLNHKLMPVSSHSSMSCSIPCD